MFASYYHIEFYFKYEYMYTPSEQNAIRIIMIHRENHDRCVIAIVREKHVKTISPFYKFP